jgi:hypothetical protein
MADCRSLGPSRPRKVENDTGVPEEDPQQLVAGRTRDAGIRFRSDLRARACAPKSPRRRSRPSPNRAPAGRSAPLPARVGSRRGASAPSRDRAAKGSAGRTPRAGVPVYLGALDQFIKHELKARYYVRYCDDIVLLSEDAAELSGWERAIAGFLDARLRLRLNDRRKLRPASCRAVFPWPWPLLAQVRQWLGSYVAHFERASSHRLLVGLRLRFSWLDEYFVWKGTGVELRCAVPRLALRFARQKSWFRDRLPGHVQMVREGPFVEKITEGVSAAAIEAWPRRVPLGLLPGLKRLLWTSNVPVAWIDETGRPPGSIAERSLIRRWGARSVRIATC